MLPVGFRNVTRYSCMASCPLGTLPASLSFIYLPSSYANRLELTIWLVPSLVANAISISLIGFFLGPMYPAVMNQAVRQINTRTGILFCVCVGLYFAAMAAHGVDWLDRRYVVDPRTPPRKNLWQPFDAGFGQAGSALLPFVTGALANKFGIITLQPL